MERCTKNDSAGMGCVREAGHAGRCKVRDLAEWNSDQPGAAKQKPATLKGRRPGGSVSTALAALAETVGQVEAEVAGLLADYERSMAAMRQRLDAANAKATATLKALVRSRRQCQAMLGERADEEPVGGDEQ